MAEEKLEFDELYEEELVGDDYSGNKKYAAKAVEHVKSVFDTYKNARSFKRGGQQFDLVREWDRRYRAYKAIYLQSDHSYKGTATVFNPILRKTVNTIESEMSNALFGREDYFSVDALGNDDESIEMSREAFATLKYYSDLEEYVYNFELADKQQIIYDSTWVETVYEKKKVTGVYRSKKTTPVVDPATGQPAIDPQTGQPLTDTTIDIIEIDEDKPTVKIEVRDIYRMYVNHLLDNPEDDDIIYQDAMSTQHLLNMVERGVYNKSATTEMLSEKSTYGETFGDGSSQGGSEAGHTFVNDTYSKDTDVNDTVYEVLRFQGLFTTKDEKTGAKIRKNFWIDIGERKHCLRLRESPVIGDFKTFSGCSYDSMVGEFNADSAISPYLDLQFTTNDKENQSLDALTFNLNGPIEVRKNSGVTQAQINISRKNPNTVIFVNEKDSVKKIMVDVPLAHLNNEQFRIQDMIESGTGATSLAAGAPTGTQADRSGKALGTLLEQTRSQFSKHVRKFEKRLIEKSLQKCWDIIIQFFDDKILIPIQGVDGVMSSKSQTPSEIIGQFRINVSAGSEYLKERQKRDSILELLSIASINDKFMGALDVVPMLQDIAMSLSPKLAKYVNPDNLVNQMQQQIDKMQQALEQVGAQNKDLFDEGQRLQGELKQTNRAAAATPGPIETQELKTN
tara:strand:+ start:2782 stop:4815 length:2034 start_codon:yes stop_codon:yes gene_type:complete